MRVSLWISDVPSLLVLALVTLVLLLQAGRQWTHLTCRCVDTDSEFHSSNTQLLINILISRTFRPEGLCQLLQDEGSCKQLTKTFKLKCPHIEYLSTVVCC